MYPLSVLPIIDYMIRKKIEVDNIRIIARGKARASLMETISKNYWWYNGHSSSGQHRIRLGLQLWWRQARLHCKAGELRTEASWSSYSGLTIGMLAIDSVDTEMLSPNGRKKAMESIAPVVVMVGGRGP